MSRRSLFEAGRLGEWHRGLNFEVGDVYALEEGDCTATTALQTVTNRYIHQ
jgi:hypothetical protein